MHFCLATAFVLLLIPTRSDAAILIAGKGPTIRHLGPVVNHAAAPGGHSARALNLSVGYQFQCVSLFGIEFWTWKGGYCLYGGVEPIPLSREHAAVLLDRDPDAVTPPFAYRYPPGLLGAGGLALIVVLIAMRSWRRRGLRAVSGDARYREAMDVVARHRARQEEDYSRWEQEARQAQATGGPLPPRPLPPPTDAGFEEAVRQLVAAGIPRDDAERNLRTLL